MMIATNAVPQSPPEISTHWASKKGLSQNNTIAGTARADGGRHQRLVAAEGVSGINENRRKKQVLLKGEA